MVKRVSQSVASAASQTWAARIGAGSRRYGWRPASGLVEADQARLDQLLEVLRHRLPG